MQSNADLFATDDSQRVHSWQGWRIGSFTRLGLILLFVAAGSLALHSTAAASVDAKQRFVELKCNNCHAVSSVGITVQGGDDDEESGDVEPPDLSTVGDSHDKGWIARYLLRREKIEDREHPRRFRASREDLAALAEWLGGLKSVDSKPAD